MNIWKHKIPLYTDLLEDLKYYGRIKTTDIYLSCPDSFPEGLLFINLN